MSTVPTAATPQQTSQSQPPPPQTPQVQQTAAQVHSQAQAQMDAQARAQAAHLFQQRRIMMFQQQQLARSGALPGTPLINQGSPAGTLPNGHHPSGQIPNGQALPDGPLSKSLPTGPLQRTQTMGQAVLRLLQFAEQLNPGVELALDHSFWEGFVDDFFTPTSTLKMTLWNAKTHTNGRFEVIQSLLVRYFHTQYDCGVISIQLTLEQTTEYILAGGLMNVECPQARLIHRYDNGSLVVSTGHLMVQFALNTAGIWKIEILHFATQGHEEFLARDTLLSNGDKGKSNTSNSSSPTIVPLPESAVNAWGVPERVYHILDLADAAQRFQHVAFHAIVNNSAPRESLNAIAYNVRQQLAKANEASASGKSCKSPKNRVAKKSTKRRKLNENKSTVNKQAGNATETGNDAAFVGAPSPVVKTQSGSRPNAQSLQLQQEAMAQMQQQKALQYHQHQQQALLRQHAAMLQRQNSPLGQHPSLQQLQHQHALQIQQQQAAMQLQQQQQQAMQLQLQQEAQHQQPQIPPAAGQTPQQAYPQAYPGQFTPHQQHTQLNEFTQSPVMRKRNNSVGEATKSPVTRKKTATPTPSRK
ncbi:hypothetical protein DFQ28_008100 [Apophysomyces sp. BC1034]|nr:hypothetical protein DFQ30_006944 [Apophysomyces sp. BC1015]KAG0176016.1 hypothetical protein DFQ29_006650 [Apophysomyces sp. BC1021]KAG0192710.1 hypothetical protein DFQ28_008100 [Apophysomyces sp. BC1034]